MSEKQRVLMEKLLGKPNGVAALGADGKLAEAQIPGLDKLGAAPAGFGLGTSAIDISGQNLVTAVASKCGFYKGSNVTHAPTSTACWFLVEGSNGGNTVIAVPVGGTGVIYHAVFENDAETVAWTKLATTDYALPRNGSQPMTGPLSFGDYTRLSGDKNGVKVVAGINADSTNSSRQFVVSSPDYAVNIANAIKLYDVDSSGTLTSYDIFHTGNKPYGSYTGNGDATKRTIETGGIGKALILYTDTYGAVIVTPIGGYGLGEGIFIAYNEVHYNNGVLTLATTNTDLNASGLTYYYQVL